MNDFLASHEGSVFLMPGEVVVASGALLVSTVLGSCIAVTMHVPGQEIGAICHAMFPHNPHCTDNQHYVDSAILAIHRKISCMAKGRRLVVKLFGGAQVLQGCNYSDARLSVGEQNTRAARTMLDQLGLTIAKADVGSVQGRKLFFSIKSGDVYLCRIGLRKAGYQGRSMNEKGQSAGC